MRVPWEARSKRAAPEEETTITNNAVNTGKQVYVAGTVLSVAVSLALYLTGRREAGTFVGLWAPTILLLGRALVDED